MLHPCVGSALKLKIKKTGGRLSPHIKVAVFWRHQTKVPGTHTASLGVKHTLTTNTRGQQTDVRGIYTVKHPTLELTFTCRPM